ncbi:MAG: hypothetical protein ABIC95_02495, partial [archaeon]
MHALVVFIEDSSSRILSFCIDSNDVLDRSLVCSIGGSRLTATFFKARAKEVLCKAERGALRPTSLSNEKKSKIDTCGLEGICPKPPSVLRNPARISGTGNPEDFLVSTGENVGGSSLTVEYRTVEAFYQKPWEKKGVSRICAQAPSPKKACRNPA